MTRDGTAYTVGADGQRVDYVYDEFGQQIATIGAEVEIDGQVVRHRIETEYNDLGQVSVEWSGIAQHSDGTIDRSGARSVSYEYNIRGNVIKTTYADGTFITATYDDLGRKATETNQLGHTRSFQYDERGQLIAVTLPSFTDKDGKSRHAAIPVRLRCRGQSDQPESIRWVAKPPGPSTNKDARSVERCP